MAKRGSTLFGSFMPDNGGFSVQRYSLSPCRLTGAQSFLASWGSFQPMASPSLAESVLENFSSDHSR
ncbi:MAG: hypothetical protein IJD35_06915 [Clostridia bacterium]|nr:hypothetical protein [Clostridia bacterium]